MRDIIESRFAEALARLPIVLSDEQLETFDRYFRLLIEWNERMNLTAITDRESVYFKHFYDSLLAVAAVAMGDVRTMADIGTGAGFPGIPLKIAFPGVRLTLIDSLGKRVAFLRHAVETLNLDNVTCMHGRAEELGRKPELRDRFDLVAARAVARLSVLNELCLPFVRTGGCFLAMKGSRGREETEEAGRSLEVLNAQIESTVCAALPDGLGDRVLIVVRKRAPTPRAYPRKPGVPAKSPL